MTRSLEPAVRNESSSLIDSVASLPNQRPSSSGTPAPSRDRPSPQRVPLLSPADKRAHLRYRYGGPTGNPRDNVRLAELEKLFLKRFGSPQLPDDDCGIECAALMLHHLAFRIDPERRMNLWLSAWCWWMSTTQRAALIQFVLSRPRTFSADALAIEMNVHFHEREELGLRTIGAVDFLKADRERRRKEKDRQRKAKERRAAGAVSRTENAAKSKPWNVLGVSKATYYRRKKEALKA